MATTVTFGTGSAAMSKAEQIIEMAAGMSSQFASSAQTLISELTEEANLTVPSIEVPGQLSLDAVNKEYIAAPQTLSWETFNDQLLDINYVNQLLQLQNPTFETVAVPDFTELPPVLSFPERPSDVWPEFTATEPNIDDVVVPDAPDFVLPPAPEFDAEVQLPILPTVQEIPLGADAPVFDLEPPGTVFIWNEEQYRSDLLTATIQKLQTDIENGGTGLSQEVEDAIIARTKARNQLSNQKLVDDVDGYYSARGWNIPHGPHAAAIRQILIEIKRAEDLLANEVMIKSFDLAQENTKFTVTSVINLEKNLLDYTSQVAQRSFEAAKYTAEYAVIVFNALVKKLEFELETYKTTWSVFETRTRAELVKLENYKAQIEGATLGLEAKKTLVSIYSARLSSITSLLDIFKTQLQGTELKANISAKKLEVFRARIEAFTAEVGAKTSEYNAYAACVAGETSKVEAYNAQASAFGKRLDAAKVKADIESTRVESILRTDEQKLKALESVIANNESIIKRYAIVEETKAKSNAVAAEIFNANVTAAATRMDTAVKELVAKTDAYTGHSNAVVAAAKAQGDLIVAAKNVAVEALRGATNASSQLSAGAMSMLQTSASLGYSASTNDSQQLSESHSSSSDLTKSVHEYIHYYNENT
jgi:hypothetical protein